jgi:hypothetical protein
MKMISTFGSEYDNGALSAKDLAELAECALELEEFGLAEALLSAAYRQIDGDIPNDIDSLCDQLRLVLSCGARTRLSARHNTVLRLFN